MSDKEDIDSRTDLTVKQIMRVSDLSRWDAEMIVGGVVKALSDNGLSVIINEGWEAVQ